MRTTTMEEWESDNELGTYRVADTVRVDRWVPNLCGVHATTREGHDAQWLQRIEATIGGEDEHVYESGVGRR